MSKDIQQPEVRRKLTKAQAKQVAKIFASQAILSIEPYHFDVLDGEDDLLREEFTKISCQLHKGNLRDSSMKGIIQYVLSGKK